MKLSEKHFDLYVRECHKWLDYFGIKDWEVDFSFDDSDPSTRAWCEIGPIQGRTAVLGLTKTWPYGPKTTELKRVAFHEVCELLLMPLRHFMQHQGANELHSDEHVHRLIRTFENSVFRASLPKSRRKLEQD